MALQPGQTIGPYRILQQVGMGGMATVYKAYHPAMDRTVALKILPESLAADPTFQGRFQQEVRLIASLEHPNILPVYDAGVEQGIHYLVMRYLEAGTLKERLERGPLPAAELARLAGQLASALQYAHERGIVHRDVKPSNVLAEGAAGNAFLTDFGVAKLVQGSSRFTATDALIGTPAYMSPEQAQGLPADARSDQYSLGVVVYEMLTGRVPFEAETPVAVVLMHISEPLIPPRTFNPGISERLENTLLKALAKDPADRYRTVAEFDAALQAALQRAQAPTLAGPTAVPPPLPARASTLPGAAPSPPRPVAPPASR
ncbi:MAG: serine/threonine protein kinase, partial [Chloroflexi bacterium]|nr:serine/threonine protein kinase [Chloroflexota bacterium]